MDNQINVHRRPIAVTIFPRIVDHPFLKKILLGTSSQGQEASLISITRFPSEMAFCGCEH
jgi:hypothetical protein